LVWRDLAGFRHKLLRALRWQRRSSRLSETQVERLRDEDTHLRVAQHLPRLYSEVRVFHACRPESLDPYMREGLRPLSALEAEQVARDVFLAADPRLTEEHLRAAIKELRPDGRDGHLYAALDDRLFVQDSGHYLIYGSEYVAGLAVQLAQVTGTDYQAWLRRRGTPTIIAAALPVVEIPEHELQQLAAVLCREIAGDPGCEYVESEVMDFTFARRTGIPPDRLRGFTHPTVIPDPLRGMVPYRFGSGGTASGNLTNRCS